MKLATAVAVAAVAVAACGRKDEAPKPAAAPPPSEYTAAPEYAAPPAPSSPITFTPLPATEGTPAPAIAAPATGVAVSSLTLGNAVGADRKIQGVIGTIGANDTVYLSIETTGSGDATLKSRWTYHQGGQATVVKEESQRIAPGGPSTHAFHVDKPGGWPKGDYQVEVFVNGASAGRQRFTIA